MVRCAILTMFSIMALSLSVIAQAQSQYSAQTSALKNDGRFIAQLGTNNPQSLIFANGLVQNLDIEIEWWSLIGQPVEIYGIKWERGYEYNLGGKTLMRSSLRKYPDLEARFDDLKPTNIKVSFDATFITDNNSSGPNFFRSGNASATKTTDNFLIAESGKMMRDFSPSSPRDWKSFIGFPGHFGHSQNLSADEANLRAENTFKAAQKIVFKNLRITEVNLPDASARAIYDEYLAREKGESRSENNDGPSCNENIAKKCFNDGKSSYDQKDYNSAFKSFQKACNSGDMQGCYWLGWLYEDGSGVSVDYQKAFTLYEQAANGGNAKAFNAIGNLYKQGRGVSVNYSQARTYYGQSCDRGERWGCYQLGLEFELGRGGAESEDKAGALYIKACDKGLEIACKRL